MMCGGEDKEAEQSSGENQTYEAEDSEDTISPILPSSNNFSYGSTDLIRKKSLINQEISQSNPSAFKVYKAHIHK